MTSHKKSPGRPGRKGCELRLVYSAPVAPRQPTDDEVNEQLFRAYCVVWEAAQQTRELKLCIAAGKLWSAFVSSFCE